MAEARKKLPKFTSPKAPFRYPKLTEPDYGNDEFPKPSGEYSVQIIFQADSAEAQSLIKQLTPYYAEAKSLAAEEFGNLKITSRKAFEKKGVTGPQVNPLYSVLYDKETEEPTGEIVFKATMKASGVYKKGPKEGETWHRKPVIFDAKGNRMNKPPQIWGGSVGKVSFEASPYFIPGTAAAGLSLKLQGVQIIELVTDGGASAESMGFTKEDDGYEYVAPLDAVAAVDAARDDDSEDPGDF